MEPSRKALALWVGFFVWKYLQYYGEFSSTQILRMFKMKLLKAAFYIGIVFSIVISKDTRKSRVNNFKQMNYGS